MADQTALDRLVKAVTDYAVEQGWVTSLSPDMPTCMAAKVSVPGHEVNLPLFIEPDRP